jgi:tetratricopeptide (TPR) repeat protein
MEYGIVLFPLRHPWVWAGMSLAAGLAFVCGKVRQPVLRFSAWWFLISFLPVSNFYPLNAYLAEHWLYMPSVGIFLTLAVGILSWAKKGRRAKAASFLVAVFAVIFWSILTIRQNLYWRDPVVFHERLARYAPTSARVFNNLGNYYQQGGRMAQAIEAYEKAIALRPDQPDAYVNLGAAYQAQGKTGEAIGMYKKALSLNNDHANAHLNLSIAYYRLRQYDDAILHYDQARRLGIVKEDLARILEPHRKQ